MKYKIGDVVRHTGTMIDAIVRNIDGSSVFIIGAEMCIVGWFDQSELSLVSKLSKILE